ncbi:MAG: serine-type D-Ala-D-Ala carboxypeptidase [Woeseia sp.]|nr:serine-type D-Ala-D-Ala carboxypeptidase [Woeseia sp.]|tara:strand:+ start:128 stop:1270 length:1143 start_codon:yes stop_codon:yes gene_type:complete
MFIRYYKTLLVTFFLLFSTYSLAQAPIPSAPIVGAKSYLVIDSKTGYEIAALNPDLSLEPASLTKIMTTYVAFKSIENGQISFEEEVTISEKAWRTEGSRMFIEVGTKVKVKDLLYGIIIQSGNDASVALAEHIAGTEDMFAELMNQYANALGMNSSNFLNSTGLPSVNHITTARDLAILTRAIIQEFPDFYKWHSIKNFTYNNIKQNNRNSLLWRDESIDGVKTGYTEDAGYCLVSSAKRNDMRVISVVLGTSSNKARSDGSQALINYAFRFFETKLLFKAGEEISKLRVWKSKNIYSSLGVLEDLYITLQRGSYNNLQSNLEVPAAILAPISTGQPIANLILSLNGEEIFSTPLRSLEDNPLGTFWQRSKDTINLWFE